ncbi:MAG: phage terminase small subunit P27 family [Fusobacterium necrophorum]|nr:phage terminase small subunit P27 family [Fusobacterium necrophorum]
MGGRPAKPVSLCEKSSRLTKAEKNAREESENKFKGVDDKIYNCPKEFKTKREKELYLFLIKNLKNTGILNNLDIEIIKSTVFCIIQLNDAQEFIKKHGQTIIDDSGRMSKNPAINTYKDFHSIFLSNSIRLGLSPSDRAKLAILDVKNKQKEEDPLLKIVNKLNASNQ